MSLPHTVHSIPIDTTYREVTAVLENRQGHHPEEAFLAEPRRDQEPGESRREFVVATDHSADRAYVDSTKQNVIREAA